LISAIVNELLSHETLNLLNITLKFRNDIYILLCVYLFIYLFIAFTFRKTSFI